MAAASLVLGILSLFTFGLTGIPAIICGYVTRRRMRNAPSQYGGAGKALAGLIMGYIGVAASLVLVPAVLLPAYAKAKARADSMWCANYMMQMGKALRFWAMDHGDQYPFNVSTNQGGTREWCARGADGFDRNSFVHFLVTTNYLSTPFVLVCPSDRSKTVASGWSNLHPANVTYLVNSAGDDAHPQEALVICPIHGCAFLYDGSVQFLPRYQKPR